jgi:protein-tyrosine phosphatase
MKCGGKDSMARHKQQIVLFLCTGNYYRSRFAEILFNSVADKVGLSWRAFSKGLALERGINNIGPMAVAAIEALESKGIDAADAVGRFPLQVMAKDLEAADRVVALKRAEHLPLLQDRFPVWAGKVEFWHVDDAPGVLGLIEQEVMDLVARLLGDGERQEGQPPEDTVTESQVANDSACGDESETTMLPLYRDDGFTFRFAEDRIIPRFHLEGVRCGQRVSVFKIDPRTSERLALLASATVGDGGWVDLREPIIVRAAEAFIAVLEEAQ